jgi:hypothetical protein
MLESALRAHMTSFDTHFAGPDAETATDDDIDYPLELAAEPES